MIYNLDKNLGRIMRTINESGEANNTIIIFTSDNGGLATAEDSPTCNFPLRDGKGWMYEGGVRVPLIIKWPKITSFNSICDLPVTSPDFYPTILNMANLPLIPEQHKDGLSLVPLLKDSKKIDRDMIFWHYPHYGNQGGKPASSIRKGDYKLIEFFEDNHLELYNLKEDIKEINNLVSIKQKEAKEMKELLYKWRNQINVKIPEHNPDFIPWLSKYY
jgi:arylsulfatase A-like enzyme